jgi:hypothetical protein
MTEHEGYGHGFRDLDKSYGYEQVVKMRVRVMAKAGEDEF